MFSRKSLLITTALVELGTGLALISVPDLVLWILLGIQEANIDTIIVGRVAGVGLLAIGMACWFASSDTLNPSLRGLLWGILIYNAGASTVLAWAGEMTIVGGIALWPAAAFHALMSIWCIVNLRTISPIKQ